MGQLRSRAKVSSWMGLRSISIMCAQHQHNAATGRLTLQAHRQSQKGSRWGRPRAAPAAPAPAAPAPTRALREMPPASPTRRTPDPKPPAGRLLRESPSQLPRAPAQCAPLASPKGEQKDEARYSPLRDRWAAFCWGPLPQVGGPRAYPRPGGWPGG